MEQFRNRIDAKITIEQFRRLYNEVTPHSSLGNLTPAEFKQQLNATTKPEVAISQVTCGPKEAIRSPPSTSTVSLYPSPNCGELNGKVGSLADGHLGSGKFAPCRNG
jgi:hypothetical protein